MTWTWQDIAAIICVVAASVYVLSQLVAHYRSKSSGGCGQGCSGCVAADASTPILLQISTTKIAQ